MRTVTRGGDPAAGPFPLADPSGVLRRGLGGAGWALIRPDGYLVGAGPLTGTLSLRQLQSTLAACHLKQPG